MLSHSSGANQGCVFLTKHPGAWRRGPVLWNLAGSKIRQVVKIGYQYLSYTYHADGMYDQSAVKFAKVLCDKAFVEVVGGGNQL
jgi:hypothetical protein